ncbi:hypothetical protein [Hymenobacter sp. B81]|uniref:hypothetical protein n=1 Tax=Hymenobacter sp. B81 TaxID=3344878 RepID=UPI0037DC1E8B
MASPSLEATDTPPVKPVPTPTDKTFTGNLPRSERPLAELAKLAAEEWQKRPPLTLLWTSSTAFATLAANFAASLSAAGEAADTLSPQAARLQVLDRLINQKIRYVKKALALQYDDEDDGRPYYGAFGIVREGRNYRLPAERSERVNSLGKLLAALPEHGLDTHKYGTAFWQPIATEYTALATAADHSKGSRSTGVAGKNELREQVEEVLLALLSLLKANYPKTYKAERRAFGFLKESY